MAIKIYLTDLVHTWEKSSTWTFPLNIGYIGAYAKKVFGGDIDIRLFKRPEILIEELRKNPPDILGLAYYVWNANLNNHMANIAKDRNPEILVMGGGPNFTSLNKTLDQAAIFFREQPNIDGYIFNQGERAFTELVQTFISSTHNTKETVLQTIQGCVTRGDLDTGGTVKIGADIDAIRDLDEIPSPYLNGMLDEFFDEPFAPVLETNRSCPYRCTFCAWGIGTTKLAKYSEERVKAEIDYIGQRCKNAVQMFIADANFGILERDERIGHWLTQSFKTHGFPGHLAVQWHKSKPERVLATARAVKDIARIGASMQSLHLDTLAAVKRKNMPLDDVVSMIDTLRSEGTDMPLVSELILGMPEETKESHLNANRSLIDLGAEMINYNLYLLPGTEMDTQTSRETYFHKTGWRLMDNAFGMYDGVHVFEGQETVQETSTMPRDELRGFRFYHFLLQFMWGGRWYFDYLQLFKSIGVHPVDMLDLISQRCREAGGKVGDLHAAFTKDHDLEAFKTYKDMVEHWSKEINFERLRDGSYGKLNYGYTFKVLLECPDEFDKFLINIGQEVLRTNAPKESDLLEKIMLDLLDFGRSMRIKLTNTLELVSGNTTEFEHNIFKWRDNGYADPRKEKITDKIRVEFYLPKNRKSKVNGLLHQYRSHNINMTLRKMSEYIKPQEFFYDVRPTNKEVSHSSVSDKLSFVSQTGTHDSFGAQPSISKEP